MRKPSPPPEPARYTLDRQSYEVAKARTGYRYDQTVAAELKIHPVTWSRILTGEYRLTEAKAQAIRRVFPNDYDHIVREVVPDAPAVPSE